MSRELARLRLLVATSTVEAVWKRRRSYSKGSDHKIAPHLGKQKKGLQVLSEKDATPEIQSRVPKSDSVLADVTRRFLPCLSLSATPELGTNLSDCGLLNYTLVMDGAVPIST